MLNSILARVLNSRHDLENVVKFKVKAMFTFRVSGHATFIKCCHDAYKAILRHLQIEVLQFWTGGGAGAGRSGWEGGATEMGTGEVGD